MTSRADSILLVTLTPPGDGNVGEIILKDLSGLLPAGTIQVLVVAPRASLLNTSDGFKFYEAPADARKNRFPGKLGAVAHAIRIRTFFAWRAQRLARAIAAEAVQRGVGRV